MTTEVLPLRAGEQLACSTCSTKVVVVAATSEVNPEITCGGTVLQAAKTVASPAPDGSQPATLIGKRYVTGDETVELLCTSSGSGSLECNGEAMSLKAAKSLPASD
ncbi:hypothetical protein G3I13_04950 [Streptomyces sp. SID6673]|nr:hypothetical protein [Streptomyces sp. SID11726]NEB23671.1 hypothetical protein [Streptomyces sp. SID6673]